MKFVNGKKYRLKQDYSDLIYGLVPKGTMLVFEGKNLGYAKFNWKGKSIAIRPKQAFKIMEEVCKG